jgi:hypothetical protein
MPRAARAVMMNARPVVPDGQGAAVNATRDIGAGGLGAVGLQCYNRKRTLPLLFLFVCLFCFDSTPGWSRIKLNRGDARYAVCVYLGSYYNLNSTAGI